MNTGKSFVTCYDKGCEEYAETLMTLVSKDKALMNIIRKQEEFNKDRGIVSGEYVLTIGKKGSEYNSRNFKDIYNNYGIHFGYYGAKAWIYCDDYDWDINSQFEFNKEFFSFLDELGMKTEDFDEKARKLYEKLVESQKQTIKGKQRDHDSAGMNAPVMRDDIDAAMKSVLNELLIDFSYWDLFSPFAIRYFIRKWKKKAKRRNNQYRFAIVLFYHRYLHDFLGIKEELCEEQNF
jgi:hypothetical protein